MSESERLAEGLRRLKPWLLERDSEVGDGDRSGDGCGEGYDNAGSNCLLIRDPLAVRRRLPAALDGWTASISSEGELPNDSW